MENIDYKIMKNGFFSGEEPSPKSLSTYSKKMSYLWEHALKNPLCNVKLFSYMFKIMKFNVNIKD